MNMKTLTILSVGLLGAASASAAGLSVSTSNTLCRIEVASSTTNTIVAVPLKAIAQADATITVADYVATNNLANGDLILYKNNGTWNAWQLQDGTWVGTTTSSGNITSATAGGNDATMDTGSSFWLVRNAPAAGSFYMYGETNATVTLPEFTRSSSSLVYTMMPNPNLTDTAINSFSFTTTPVSGDRIQVPTDGGATEYIYKNNSWCTASYSVDDTTGLPTTTYTATTDTIPAGQGFWYIGKKSSSN